MKKNEFVQGYICAVANLLRERDTPEVAQGLLESLNHPSVKSLRESGCDNQDIAVLKKYKLVK